LRPIGDFAASFSDKDLGDYLYDDPPAVLMHDAIAGSFKPASGDLGNTISRIEERFVEEFDAGGDETGEQDQVTIPRGVAYMAVPLVSQHDPENRRMIVGRTRACDIQIDDMTVSRRQAVIERRDDQYFISDLFSTVGTSVNGQVLEPSTEHRLSPGERVTFGTVDFTFLDAAAFYLFVRSFLGDVLNAGAAP